MLYVCRPSDRDIKTVVGSFHDKTGLLHVGDEPASASDHPGPVAAEAHVKGGGRKGKVKAKAKQAKAKAPAIAKPEAKRGRGRGRAA